jgi:peptidoglycan hydrolase-like protein with peptidoglycan-binding domain
MRVLTGLSAAVLMGCATFGAVGASQAQTVSLTFTQPLSLQGTEMVQQRLRQAGDYMGGIDGAWGPDSVLALQRFQSMHGLQPTGQMNSATAMAMGLDPASLFGQPAYAANTAPAYVPPPPAIETMSPRGVAAVQGRLREYGYYRGPVDGVWGPATQNAIGAFQQARGLLANGLMNTTTAAAMGLNAGWLMAGG